LGSDLAGDIMHLLVIMKTMSVTIDRQVLISLVSVLVSFIVSKCFWTEMSQPGVVDREMPEVELVLFGLCESGFSLDATNL
jgi:hypothetical protein